MDLLNDFLDKKDDFKITNNSDLKSPNILTKD